QRSVGRTGFREMIASGWRTAPPQVIDFEVVLATNSAWQQLLEASPRVPDPPRVAPRKLSESTRRAELFQHLAPVIELSSRASADFDTNGDSSRRRNGNAPTIEGVIASPDQAADSLIRGERSGRGERGDRGDRGDRNRGRGRRDRGGNRDRQPLSDAPAPSDTEEG